MSLTISYNLYLLNNSQETNPAQPLSLMKTEATGNFPPAY